MTIEGWCQIILEITGTSFAVGCATLFLYGLGRLIIKGY